MAATWTIQKASEDPRSLLELKVIFARMSFRSLAPDELVFSMTRSDVLAAPEFSYGDILTLWKDGVRWFKGTVTRLPAQGSAKTEGDEYTVSGPWWYLENIVYQQVRSIANGGFTGFNSVFTSHIVLQQNTTSTKITTGAQISAVVTYATTQGAPLAAGSIPVFVNAPLDEVRDLTCAECIKHSLAWSPDVVSWFDYSGATPILNMAARASLTGIAKDLTAGNLVESFSLTPRNDLVPAGVVFVYETTKTDANGVAFTETTTDFTGAIAGIGVVMATIELTGNGTDNAEPVPSGLAAAFYASLATLQFEGELITKEIECTGDLRPGKKLNLDNGRTAWASMDAQIQTVSEDLLQGMTTVSFGPASHLTPQDFVNMLLFNRKSGLPQKGDLPQVQHTLNGADPNAIAGHDPNATKSAAGAGANLPSTTADGCEGGTPKTMQVYGKVL